MAAPTNHGWHKMLVERYGRAGDALHMFVTALPALAVMGVAAWLLRLPMLVPSLGPTVYMLFEWPLSASSSPRNTIIGHGVAIVVGALCLALFGLLNEPSVLQTGVGPARIGAAALSLAVTEAILILIRAQHPPAGATVLIVSLGMLTGATQLLSLAAAIVLLTYVAWSINRAAGTPVPIWQGEKQTDRGS